MINVTSAPDCKIMVLMAVKSQDGTASGAIRAFIPKQHEVFYAELRKSIQVYKEKVRGYTGLQRKSERLQKGLCRWKVGWEVRESIQICKENVRGIHICRGKVRGHGRRVQVYG